MQHPFHRAPLAGRHCQLKFSASEIKSSSWHGLYWGDLCLHFCTDCFQIDSIIIHSHLSPQPMLKTKINDSPCSDRTLSGAKTCILEIVVFFHVIKCPSNYCKEIKVVQLTWNALVCCSLHHSTTKVWYLMQKCILPTVSICIKTLLCIVPCASVFIILFHFCLHDVYSWDLKITVTHVSSTRCGIHTPEHTEKPLNHRNIKP